MDNLREDFRNWLVGQGISDKLINGKSSTVYEYIRQLDVLSKKLYASDDWNLLIENAVTLLFFYFTIKRGVLDADYLFCFTTNKNNF